MKNTAKPALAAVPCVDCDCDRVRDRASASAWAMRSWTAERFGIFVRLSVRAAWSSTLRSRRTSSVTSLSTAIRRMASSFMTLSDSTSGAPVARRAVGGAAKVGANASRSPSHTSPYGPVTAAHSARNCGTSGSNTSNKLSRPTSADTGSSRFTAIGFIISTLPSSAICTMPTGTRCRN